MKKLLGALMMLVVVQVNAAEWELVAGADRKDVNEIDHIYIHIPTLIINGHFVTAWRLTDFRTMKSLGEGKSGFYSMKILETYNCEQRKLTRKRGMAYSQKMGRGVVVIDQTFPEKTTDILPKSADYSVMKYLCRKR